MHGYSLLVKPKVGESLGRADRGENCNLFSQHGRTARIYVDFRIESIENIFSFIDYRSSSSRVLSIDTIDLHFYDAAVYGRETEALRMQP